MIRRNGLRRHGFFLRGCLVLVLILFIASLCYADDAMVLPKGRWMTSLGLEYYPEWDKQFNQDGDEEALAHDYNRELNSTVFTSLAGYENPMLLGALAMMGVSLPADYEASVGRSIVEFEKTATITNILLNYGITEKLSLGLKIPYWTFKTKVKTALDPNSATLTWNPYIADPNDVFFGQPFSIGEYLIQAKGLLPAQVNALKLTESDVIDLLSQQFGYKRFETWSDSDLGDMELGLKYQYLKNEKWRLALQGGVRFPTGQVDDPDNLADYGFGGGNYDIIIGAQNDYLGFKDFVLNGTLRYTNQLPDKEELRIPPAVDIPLTAQKEKVNRDLGDVIEVELSGNYKFKRDFGLNATYGGYFKESDRVKGAGGHYASLEGETKQIGHTLTLGVSYNTLARYQETQAGIPYLVSLSHWQRFAGENMNKAQYICLKAALFF